jgi:glycosyltransferase involved in cell wall biosynthesis
VPETFNRRSRAQLQMTVRYTARRAAQILTLSEYSRLDIIDAYQVDPDRVFVTPAAAPPSFRPVTDETELQRIRATYGIERDYILSLGSIQPRKNLVRLISAYASLRQMLPQMRLPQLVLAGKRGWLDSEIFRAAEQSAVKDDILFIGYVSDGDIPGLYSGAQCFAYPSYFEGFGLPLVEAMQCGAPVIAGDRTAVPEVVDGAGVLVDPFDEAAIAQALARVIAEPDFREALRVKGFERAREFNWEKTARLTLESYQRAATRR